MKVLSFLSAGMLLTALNAPVFAEKEAEVSKEDEAVSAVEVEADDAEKAETSTETAEAKNDEKSEQDKTDEVTDFNAGLANLVGDIMTDEQFALEESEEEAEEEFVEEKEAESESDEKIVAKTDEAKKDSK